MISSIPLTFHLPHTHVEAADLLAPHHVERSEQGCGLLFLVYRTAGEEHHPRIAARLESLDYAPDELLARCELARYVLEVLELVNYEQHSV
jgi:hypothetical protein